MPVRIAYYYSVDRAGRPVSAQENASRRSRKVAQRGHARSYGQAYTGCLITDDKDKRTLIYRTKNSLFARAISHESFRFNYLRDHLLHVCILLYFIRLTSRTNTHMYKLHAKHPVCEACRRASPLASASRSFILSPSPTRASHRRAFPPFVE